MITVSQNNDLSNTTVVVDNFAGLPHDNLRAHVRVYQQLFTGEKFTGAIHALYSTETLRATVNLSDVLNLSPHLPNTSALTAPFEQGLATDSFGSYTFRYADKYGYPAVAEALQLSTKKYIVAGGVATDNTTDFFALFREFVCHNYATIGSSAFPKIVTEEQPDFFYWMPKVDLEEQRIHAIVKWSDNTVTQHVIASETGFTANTLYWFSSGFKQLGLDALTNGDEIIVSYRFAIGNLDVPGNVDSFQSLVDVYYEMDMDSGRAWNTYLLFFNGVGGCESVGFFGKTKKETEASSEQIELEDSTRKNIQRRTRRRLELNTGYFDAPYIEHLQQLLTGDMWLIDLEYNRFQPLRLLTDNMQMPGDDDDPEMNALTIEVEYAKEDESYSDF